MLTALSPVLACLAILALADTASATTTLLAAPIYNYDRIAPNVQSALTNALGVSTRIDASSPTNRAQLSEDAGFANFLAAEESAAGGLEAGGGAGRIFVTTPRGTTFDIPEGYVGREADNLKGIVFQEPGAPGNAGSIRIMEPTQRYPNGYFRYYSSEDNGQPLDVNGQPCPPTTTHIPEDYIGPVLGRPGG
jgi:hypothetical protein